MNAYPEVPGQFLDAREIPVKKIKDPQRVFIGNV